jgi:hypothetical protein
LDAHGKKPRRVQVSGKALSGAAALCRLATSKRILLPGVVSMCANFVIKT